MIPWGIALLALIAGMAIGVGLMGLCAMSSHADDLTAAYLNGYEAGKNARGDDGK